MREASGGGGTFAATGIADISKDKVAARRTVNPLSE
jgi:hypothetical protein